jgi:formate dehydrogenase accessory protein FdhD
MHLSDLPGSELEIPRPLIDVGVHEAGGQRIDTVPEEVPVALTYNGISHAVMLASPTDLADFGLGFSLSEGLLADQSELYELELETAEHGVIVRMRIAEARFQALKLRRRSLAGRTGCGLCGVESLDQVARNIAPLNLNRTFPAAVLHQALRELNERQPLRDQTGGVHAAAWADCSGHVLLVREDVGRHNALDKLIGALIARALDPGDGFALITSRASFEMVQKAAGVGIPLLAAVSAPTGYAIRLAQACGLTLAGFVRQRRYSLYAHPERIEA